jgi:teichuronic acid biosynthesis glycosyltransferase TuaC
MNTRVNLRHKVLVLSRNYPNELMPHLGLWVEGSVRSISEKCDVRVVAPTPYCPPLPGLSKYKRFRQVPLQERINGIEVLHPRFLVGPGYSLYDLEAKAYYWGIRNAIDQLRRIFPFDLIHAHFAYPDGIVAERLARRYGVPFVITEHALWRPWMDNYPRIRHQVLWASQQCAFHIAVSQCTRETISHFTGETSKLRVIHNGVDGTVFSSLPENRTAFSNQILYVGVMRQVKGVDVLLKAMRRLVDQQPEARLVLVGGGFYNSYSLEEKSLKELAEELGLTRNVEFVGLKSPDEVAKYMRESTMLVLPSRRETFGTVLIEALACGTPVIATNCGGPAEIVNERVGMLIPVEDDAALAKAMATLLEQRKNYDSVELRGYALSNFSSKRIAEQTVSLYTEAIERSTASLPISGEIKRIRNGPQRFVEGS